MAGPTMRRMGDEVTIRPADVQVRFREILKKIASERASADRPKTRLGPFLTISRQVDSGGAEVANKVGLRLGWAVFDRELVDKLARQLDLSPELLELMDETRSNWFTDTLFNLLNSKLVLQDSYVQMLGKVMLLAAVDGRVVIVGRGGHHLLPPDAGLRVRVVAPRKLRIERLRAREGLTEREAAKQLDALDKSRNDFLRRHFHSRPDDPGQYDLVLDSGTFGIDGAVELVIQALKLRGLA